ncbi:RagB/SusD family nutrient uptake outer membrane protein [Thalassobellus suaedae]|uniref:RagB/SusD family nutrient uptake outer membrane protein n=1 Tax=Thalassobellus suaedae TaxID=3074124 RepID=A0ABY9XVV6_9FLAO|nr:RagB/SusD family nutrient uptake outer membrane protein [Flavobacteriaceae bacterium HL-DH14]WNH11884.1 RagB/SusD family nutrient uptake outer membrane protein [Flavobacteriaceae bacterium HL-DH10]
MKHKIYYYLIFGIFLTSCQIDPLPIQDQTTEDLWSHSTYGEGILANAYAGLNTSYPITMDYYTDNAVPSQPGSNSLALGSWNVESSPIGNWGYTYDKIKYLNLYIENGADLIYSVSDKYRDSILKSNRLGEAYFLKAFYQAELLKNYAGKPEAGGSEVLGFPIVTKALEQGDDLDLPRNTYEECVAQIVQDCDAAIAILPLKYDGGADVFTGLNNRGRASGLAAMALKARVYLNAASPAYGPSTQALWERAATAAAEAIDASGGLTDLTPYNNFNDATSFDNIWIQPTYQGRGLESNYYPPSLFGSGQCNPSQNLVNIFPTADGYPIETSALYNAEDPYSNRDERFYRFIFFNGDVYNGTSIKTYIGGADAPGGLTQQGTRTGYYMKKLLSKTVKLDPSNTVNDIKFYVYLGKTELYLNFAEAANEAYGPDGNALGYSASDVMAKIRMRAGIDSNAGTPEYEDQYMLDQESAGTEAFRDFIQNNRRIELCFEGFRFWDIRRWNKALNHAIEGVEITRDLVNGDDYNYVNVENHTYQDYMIYAPLPYSQTLIMSNLKQNAGW